MAVEAGEQDNLVALTKKATTDSEHQAVDAEQSGSQVQATEPEQADSVDAFEVGITREPFDEDGADTQAPS